MNKTTTRNGKAVSLTSVKRVNGNGHKTRSAVKKTLDTSAQSLAVALVKIADDVFAAQQIADGARREFEGHVTALSVRALGAAVFPGKTDGDPLRVAANDQERKLAVELVCHEDQTYIELREAHEQAARDLALCKARQANYRIAAQLILKG